MVLKFIFSIAVLTLTCACKPAQPVNDKASQTQKFQCISSQNHCQIPTDFGNFSVKFSQFDLFDNVKTELPFAIELSNAAKTGTQMNTALSVTSVSAFLEGRDMFMGKVPVFFEKHSESKSYRAKSLLANCTEEQMVWRLWITLESLEQQQTFFVDFTSVRL